MGIRFLFLNNMFIIITRKWYSDLFEIYEKKERKKLKLFVSFSFCFIFQIAILNRQTIATDVQKHIHIRTCRRSYNLKLLLYSQTSKQSVTPPTAMKALTTTPAYIATSLNFVQNCENWLWDRTDIKWDVSVSDGGQKWDRERETKI